MLIHIYVFLSTLFVGMQGVAFYRYKIQKLNQEEKISVKEVQQLSDQKYRDVESQIYIENITDEKNISDPNFINKKITQNINAIWDEYQREEVTGEEVYAEEESQSEVQYVDSKIEDEKLIASSNALINQDSEKDEFGIVVYDYASKKKMSDNKIAKKKKNEIESFIAAANIKTKNKAEGELYSAKIEFQGLTTEQEKINTNIIELSSVVTKELIPVEPNGYAYEEKKVTGEFLEEEYEAYAPEMMPVNFTAKWSSNRKIMNTIPFISHERISEWYEYFGLKGQWGMVLVKLQENVDYYEIKNFNSFVFLDSNLEETDESLAEFILYLGVTPGIQELNIKSANLNITIPLFVQENTIRFEDINLINGTSLNFSTFETLPMTKIPKMLMLNEEDVVTITGNGLISKETMNTFKLNLNTKIEDKNELIALRYSGQEYIVELGEKDQKVILPSHEYIEQVLDTANDINPSCIVELLHKKNIDFIDYKFIAIKSEFKNKVETVYTNEDQVVQRHLDEDGIFYPTSSSMTKRSYYLLENPGYLILKYTFKDGAQGSESIICGPREFHQRLSGE